MTITESKPGTDSNLVARPELTLGELTMVEQLVWTAIRQESSLEHLNYGLLTVMGKLHKCSKTLRQKINESGGK